MTDDGVGATDRAGVARAVTNGARRIPVGITPTTIGVHAAWWLDAARRADAAGLAGVWAWDHFLSRGRRTDPVLECWTTLAAASAVTTRIAVGSFVTNVLTRHPAVLARMVATIADVRGGRVEIGLGIGGYADELEAYGVDVPDVAERIARLEEAVTVLRLLLAGGPAEHEGRFFRLRGAYAFPVPEVAPRIVVAGQSSAGARLAARAGDAWTCPADLFERLLPIYREARAAAGGAGTPGAAIVGVQARAVIDDAAGTIGRLAERGADEIVVEWVRASQLDPLLEALAGAG